MYFTFALSETFSDTNFMVKELQSLHETTLKAGTINNSSRTVGLATTQQNL
jgi:hypothetical protein